MNSINKERSAILIEYKKLKKKLLLIGLFLVASIAHTQEIRIAFMAGPNQASKIRETIDTFSRESGIKVSAVAKTDSEFKLALQGWLTNEIGSPDIYFWQSSQRLFHFAENNLIYPLTTFWNDEALERDFYHVKSSVMFEKDIYAIPISYYHWGLYFKKSLIDNYGGPPKTWKEMMKMGVLMKKDGIYPFGLGNKELWPAAAWFDYINLRINGLSFHRQLLAGKISFRDRRVRSVFAELKKAIDLEYFEPKLLFSDHGDVVPMLYRGRVGFALMSNGITTRMSEIVLPEIGFIPFPKINPLHRYEEAPMDVLMVSKHTKNIKQVREFLKYMAKPAVQSEHNARMGYLPPNRRSTVNDAPFAKDGASLLRKSSGLSQYFDRDTEPEFEREALPILADFLANGKIEVAIDRLESARKGVFKR